MDVSSTALRVMRAVAETGTFTAAAAELGYTQSAVSRQVAVLEREAGAALFDRHPGGARLTADGATLLRCARVVLDELDSTARDLTGAHKVSVRLGAFVSSGAFLLPAALARLRRSAPDLRVTTREGTTPSLTRALRAGALDLAIVTSRPPHRALDTELPKLPLTTLMDSQLVVAVAADGPYAGRQAITTAELARLDWIDTPSSGAEPLLGVWPGLPGSPRIAHSTRDWLSKLRLVAAGLGVTTVAPHLVPALPANVTTLRVTDAPPEYRRLTVARRPGPARPQLAATIAALKAVADTLTG